MKVHVLGDTLSITGVKELAAANFQAFRDQVCSALTEEHKYIEIDLSQAMFVDSCGLSALASLYKSVSDRQGSVRLLNPTPPVVQFLELTRMHKVFEILKT
jgi:anti-anti-sigma factor